MDIRLLLHVLLFFASKSAVASERELLHIHAIWRHGDRTPIGTFPTDPHQEDAWPVPWGELTTKGMWQQYQQGLKMKAEYIDGLKLLSPNYTLNEIYVRSSDITRALLSAYSNMAGFYSDSKGTHPDEAHWPSTWSPVPVHTVEKENDHLLYAFPHCPRMKELMRNQRKRRGYVDYVAANKDFIGLIEEKAQVNVTEFGKAYRFTNAIFIERLYDLSTPEWVTAELYAKAWEFAKGSFNFMFGGAGFGEPENLELAQLTGGVLINEIIENMQNKVDGKTSYRYHAYSGHDTTLAGFLRTLGAKEAILGDGIADYAATFIVELWKKAEGSHAVRLRYSANAEAPFVTVTEKIFGCPAAEFCPLNTFIEHRQKYALKDVPMMCAAKDSHH